MKKTVEKVYCDDCGREIFLNEQIITLKLPYFDQKKDFCLSCIAWRVNHSFTIIEDRQCTACKGKGKVRESCGYHNDYVYEVCTICKGKGAL